MENRAFTSLQNILSFLGFLGCLGSLLFLGAGVLARLMPNMQIFFVIMPLQIFISFAILAMTLGIGMMWFMEYFEATIGSFLFPGEVIELLGYND